MASSSRGNGAPPYGKRSHSSWIPRVAEDYGDSGAFPEINCVQYPLEMGKKKSSTSKSTSQASNGAQSLAIQLNAEGEVKFQDLIARQGATKDKIIHSKFTDLLPKQITDDMPDLHRPDAETIKENTEKTRRALEAMVSAQVSAAMPVKAAPKQAPAQYIRYTPATQGEEFNSGAGQRIIKMCEAQRDPMSPPRFKINKKLPQGPPSPPAPVMHSPTRKVTVKEQQEWKIPPSISNWKNPKGYTIPLDKRLAADGRGLQSVHINENFSKFAEALYIADRKAREALEMRAKVEQTIAQKEKSKKEEDLKSLANQIREQRSGIKSSSGPTPAGAGGDQTDEEENRSDHEDDDRHKRRSRSAESSSDRSRSRSSSSSSSENEEEYETRRRRRSKDGNGNNDDTRVGRSENRDRERDRDRDRREDSSSHHHHRGDRREEQHHHRSNRNDDDHDNDGDRSRDRRDHRDNRDRDRSRDRDRDRNRDRDHDRKKKNKDGKSVEKAEEREREEIRRERQKERRRDAAISRAAPEKRTALMKEKERDVSEKIALGLPNTGHNTGDVQFDSRLFNGAKGLDTGFGEEDSYTVYDKPWRETEQVASTIYRPSKNLNKDYGDEFENALSAKRFVPDKGFSGAQASGGAGRQASDGPVAFEQQVQQQDTSFDPFQIDDFLVNLKSNNKDNDKSTSSSKNKEDSKSSGSSKREQSEDHYSKSKSHSSSSKSSSHSHSKKRK